MADFPTEGNDVLEGDRDVYDIIEGLGGNDTIYLPLNKPGVDGGDPEFANGGEGDDTIITDEYAVLIGGPGNDTLIGSRPVGRLNPGNDVIEGGPDDDFVFGGKGDDELYGGLTNGDDDGIDTVGYGSANEVVVDLEGEYATGDHGNDSVVGFENIDGSGGADILLGDSGANVINGFNGRDVINGRQGNDIIDGGKGNDTLAGGEGNDELEGGKGNDQLVGGLDEDMLSGGPGNDLLNGGGRELDIIDGGAGARDTVSFVDNGTAIDFVLSDGVAVNKDFGTLSASVTNVEDVIGTPFDDDILGDDGDNVINGNDGNDDLVGGGGNDIVVGADGDDSIDGGEGNDFLFGQDGEDGLVGSSGNDTLFGGGDDDDLRGGSGNDNLFGQLGADEIRGGPGSDILSGGPLESPGPGAEVRDMFVWRNGDLDVLTQDTVIDFELGIDQLVFRSDFFNPNVPVPSVQDVAAGTADLSDLLTFGVDSRGTVLVANVEDTPAGDRIDGSFDPFVLIENVFFDENTLGQMFASNEATLIIE